MLDLNHPETPYTFAIAAKTSQVLAIAQRMTLLDWESKQILLLDAHDLFEKMRQMTKEGFSVSAEKLNAIDHLQQQLTTLANLPSTNDFETIWHGELCTTCGSSIQTPKYATHPVCLPCFSAIEQAYYVIDAAFALWCI